VRIISKSRLLQFARQYPKAREWLANWYSVVAEAEWTSLSEVRETYRHADAVRVASGKTVTVLNVCGNHYRLIVAIHYNRGRVYVLTFLPHAEYDRNRWKALL
jgi:mRNA interferase HigB